MVSCAAVSATILVKSYVVYHLVLLSVAVLHYILYYGIIMLALLGVGLGVGAAIFYGKDQGNGTDSTDTTPNMGESDPPVNPMSDQQKAKYY